MHNEIIKNYETDYNKVVNHLLDKIPEENRLVSKTYGTSFLNMEKI